jgi:hypothetical protein
MFIWELWFNNDYFIVENDDNKNVDGVTLHASGDTDESC